MRRVYARLATDWLGGAPQGMCLKTDLFEEATSSHPVLPDLEGNTIGLDCSSGVVRQARALLDPESGRTLVVADLRRLPFASRSVSRILSGSSLDHFDDKRDIGASIAELARVLVEGGTMVLVLDNPQNPIVWLRNRLPRSLLERVGLVPYFVGETCDRHEARRLLEESGLAVMAVAAIVHAPRAPAIWLALGARRVGGALDQALDRAFLACELLARLPTRFRTGYYIALRAEKPPVDASSAGREERVNGAV